MLQRAIRSVLAQTYGQLQVIVYDNASDDEMSVVVAAHVRKEPRVKYYCYPKNVGPVANFAYAMEQVETPYFSMLSDDDYYYTIFYATVINGFTRYPNAMFSPGTTVLAYENGRVQIGTPVDGYFPPPNGFLIWTHGKGPAVTSIVFRRDVIARAGVADKGIFHWDVEYFWRLASQFPFVTSARPGLIFTVHTARGTRQMAIDAALQSYEVIRERVQSTPGPSAEVRAKTGHFLHAWVSQAVLHAGLRAIRDGEGQRGQYAATILHIRFGQKRRAAILSLLAQLCVKGPLVSRPTRALTSVLLGTGTYVYQLSWHKRSYPAAFADTRQFVRDMTSPYSL